MEQRWVYQKASPFVNMSRRDAGAPRAELIDTAKTHHYITPELDAYAWRGGASSLPRFQR
jgi:hypothetical protein